MTQDLRLTKHDLVLIEQAPFNIPRERVIRTLKRLPIPVLSSLQTEWCAIPELQDQNINEQASHLTSKDSLIDYILKILWPRGLCLFQLAQAYNITHIKKSYKIYRLTPTEYNNSLLSLSKNEVVEGVRKYFESIDQVVSVYAQDTDTQNVFICFISYILDRQPTTCFFIFSPTIPFFMVKVDAYGLNFFEMIKGAISSLYEVTSFKVTMCGLSDAATAASSLLKESSSGLFSELKDTDHESSPLDVLSKLAKTKKTKYVSGKEVARRITALDEEEIKKRLELKDANFGDNSTIPQQKFLKIKVIGSLDDSTGIDDQELEMNIVFKGKNVGIGLKKLVEKGVIKAPCEWLETYASEQGADEINITADGVECIANE